MLHQVRNVSTLLNLFIVIIQCIGGSEYSMNTTQTPLKNSLVSVVTVDSMSTLVSIYRFKWEPESEYVMKIQKQCVKLQRNQWKFDSPDLEFQMQEKFEQLFSKISEIVNTNFQYSKYMHPPQIFISISSASQSLTPEAKDLLLESAKQSLEFSDFQQQIHEEQLPHVKMVSGKAIAIYAWLAVNYFISKYKQRADEDVTVLHLNVDSAQIAFRPDSRELLAEVNVDENDLEMDIHTMIGHGPGIFATSYRDGPSVTFLKALGAFNDHQGKLPEKKSACLPRGFKSEFILGSIHLEVAGSPMENSRDRYISCRKSLMDVMTKEAKSIRDDLHVVRKLFRNEMTYFAIGKYYDAAADINEVYKLKNAQGVCTGFKLTVHDFEKGAEKLCSGAINFEEKPYKAYTCILVTYITILQKEIYNFQSNTPIVACNNVLVSEKTFPERKVKVKLSYTLGMALQAEDILVHRHE